MPQQNTGIAFAWTSLIVASELFSFYLIQKNVDEGGNLFSGQILTATILFGLIVPFSFRKVLIGGIDVPLANLYWIVLSQIGSVLLAFFLLNQKIQSKDWIAIAFLFLAIVITLFAPKDKNA